MIRISEYVSLGHPDKVADYISQYLLDRYIERDPNTRYAVEVQIKGFRVSVAGEVSSSASFTDSEITKYVREAVNEIGYTREYMEKWGAENTICGDLLECSIYLSQQSPEIAKGLKGWGDQGIFFGYAEPDAVHHYMPKDHSIAKSLCKELFESGLGGLDIKTQVVMRDNEILKVIVAIPLLDSTPLRVVRHFVRSRLRGRYKLIVNGTGAYKQHCSVADCGTTGRKLAVDFYGGNCRIGGGSPWTKDGSKADLTLNLCARKFAICYARRYEVPVMCSLACCIGKKTVDVCIRDAADNVLFETEMDLDPAELRTAYELDKPIYASICRWGLFGQFQKTRMWER